MIHDANYNDIIAFERPLSIRHVPMQKSDRAAQFASFAALKGHSDEIKETARYTDSKTELDENKIYELNLTLQMITQKIESSPMLSLLYFRPDIRKNGGAYVNFEGRLKRIDETDSTIVFTDGTKIKVATICEITVLNR